MSNLSEAARDIENTERMNRHAPSRRSCFANKPRNNERCKITNRRSCSGPSVVKPKAPSDPSYLKDSQENRSVKSGTRLEMPSQRSPDNMSTRVRMI